MSNLIIVSSQYKNIPARDKEIPESRIVKYATTLKNEPISFQALYKTPRPNARIPVTLSIESVLPISAYRVDYVPLLYPCTFEGTDAYEYTEPGLYPDVLQPREANPEIIRADIAYGTGVTHFEADTDNTLVATNIYQSVWFTVNPKSKPLRKGKYELTVTLRELDGLTLIASERITLEIVDAMLPASSIYYTNWFHVDCLCDTHGVKPYTAAFYKIFDRYITNMTLHGQNTLLLPAFTPPLDTTVGGERMNVQLVEIEKTADGWHFGFEKMKKFVSHAKKCGVTYFEHSHLFSQWGAKHAPNIYTKDGARIFGFDTDAESAEYVNFIRKYLAEFFEFAKSEGIEKRLIFHISDEPKIHQLPYYRSAKESVKDLLCGSPVCDAMDDLEFYTEGLVDQPIFYITAEKSLTADCPDKWIYYTGAEKLTSNRKLSNTAAATRVIGLYLYKYESKGFLQWAYNYCYDRLSYGICDPKSAPGAYKMFPGIANLCYPVTFRGKHGAIPSVREELMREAMDDLRALKLLESKIGREATLAICESRLGEISIATMPRGEDIRLLREEINAKIKELI